MTSPPKKRKYVDALKPLPVSGKLIRFTCMGGFVDIPFLLKVIKHKYFYAEDANSKRQMIVKEIFETEYNYISQLNTINNVSYFNFK